MRRVELISKPGCVLRPVDVFQEFRACQRVLKQRLVILSCCWLWLAGCNSTTPPANAPANAPANKSAQTATSPPKQAADTPVGEDVVSDADGSPTLADAGRPSDGPDQVDMAAPDPDTDSELSVENEARLKAELEKNPQDAELLVALAKLTQIRATMTESGIADYPLLKTSAEYLHRAREADAAIIKSEAYQEIARDTFYNEACALSRDQELERSLASLKLSIDLGFWNLKAIEREPDLAPLRKTEGYASLMKSTRSMIKQTVSESIDEWFKEKHNFQFTFDLLDSKGQPLKMADYSGKVLMVNIWATWCGPCRSEIPDLVATYNGYKAEGFEIVGLNMENEEGEEANALIQEYQQKLKINYPCARVNEKIVEQYPAFDGSVPTSLFFDREGQPRIAVVGTIDELTLEVIVERLLAEQPKTASR